jgi:predicted nucleic acid-binding protein
MTGPCFVDANVLVYSRDLRERSKQARADAWLDLLWRENRGRTSMQVLSEFYVNARRLGVAADELWKSVERYLAWSPRPPTPFAHSRSRASTGRAADRSAARSPDHEAAALLFASSASHLSSFSCSNRSISSFRSPSALRASGGWR